MRWLVGVLVAVLAIATILLVVLALQSVRPSPVADTSTPAPTFTFGATPSPSSSAPASPSSSAPASPGPSATAPDAPAADAAYPRADERFFSIGSDGWWRATAGACGGTAPLIERSVDGGRTWQNVTPGYRGIAQVASVDSFAGSEAETVAGMGGACEVQALRTFTQGEFWQPYPEVLAASRYLSLAAPASVVLPGGTVATPCAEPRSFRAVGTVVALVCDGAPSVLGADQQWQTLPASDAVALAVSDGAVLTASPAEGCTGVTVTRWSGAGFGTSTPLGCAPAVDPAAPLALAAVDDAAVVWSADRLVPVD